MEQVELGRTGLSVSEVCLGTGGYSRLGLSYGLSVPESQRVVEAAVERGVNFFDTAAAYGTEEIVGSVVARRRDSFVVATKNHIVQPGTSILGSKFMSGAEYKRLLEQNLRRLGTDYVDILYAHGVLARQYDHCRDEIVPAMLQLREEGKIRFLGISEQFLVDTEHEMLALAVRENCFDVIMVGLNIINQTALRDVLPTAHVKGVGTQVIYAVRRRLTRLDAAMSLIAELRQSAEVTWRADQIENLLRRLAGADGAGAFASACYRFTRFAPGVDTVVVGTGSIDHLTTNIDALRLGPLPAALLDDLACAFSKVTSASAD
jgi:L-galactose dehydrogenase